MRTPLRVNRQIGGDKLKSVLKFGTCHVISRMRNDDCVYENMRYEAEYLGNF